VGLTRGTRPWFTCCVCPDDPHKGTNIEFHDCCGSMINMTSKCNSGICDDWVKQGGCADAGRCGTIQSWCDNTPGLPVCTMPVDTRAECLIS
jgi:hypothetical protein